MTPVTVVVSPAAGGGRSLKSFAAIAGELTRLGVAHEIVVSETTQDPGRIARAAAEAGAAVVAAVGGDGMVGMVAAGLVGTETALAVVPGGTGDDFARALGLDRKRPLDAVALLSDPHLRTIDVGVAETATARRVFVNIANAGFDAEVTQVANDIRLRAGSTGTYVLALLKTLRRFRPLELTVTVDGKEQVMGAMLIAVGNGSSYGGGMRVTPGARLDDGRLEACVVRAMGRMEFVTRFPQVYRGTHIHHPKVTMLHGRTFQVAADRPTPVYADGERVGTLPATFEVMPGALNVVAPVAGSTAPPGGSSEEGP